MKPRLIPPLLAGAVLYLLFVATASAHAGYKNSTPAIGEVVATAPATVEITFSQDIQKVAGTYGIEVTNAAGVLVTSGASAVSDADRSLLSVPLQPNLASGRYVVNWNNTSDDDSDPKEGAFSFYIAAQPTAADLASDTALEAIGAAEDTAPQATENPAAVSTTTITVPPTASSAIATAPASTAAAVAKKNDGGGNSTLIIVIVVVVVIAVVAAAALYLASQRRR